MAKKKGATKKKAPGKKTSKKGGKKAPALPKISEKEMHDTFFQWKLDGYQVDDLEDKIDTKAGLKLFVKYRDNIDKLKRIEADIVTLEPKGFEQEINVIKNKLKNPIYADSVDKAYGDLKHQMKEKMFISMVHEGFKIIKEPEPVAEKPAEKAVEKKAEKKVEKSADEVAAELEAGSCYLLEEEKPERSYKIFESLIAKGVKGVCVTREFPEKLRKRYKLGESTIFWLSNSEAKNTFKPVELGKLYYNLEEFLKGNEETVIMLSGLEYLITQNNYSSVLKLIQLLNEQIAIHESRLIIPISPFALEAKDLKLIERELTVLR